MSYVSLYRKYRSATFDDLVGQSHITTTLKNAIERGRISHAYLFSGPRGTGKTSTARILAKSINCEKGPAPIPCNECDNCTAISKDALFDVIEIDAASNRGIDDIRDLRDKVRVPPVQARYKIYIIDEVHMLTREASNALLKTLEEPPKHVIFIMATTEPQKMLATILSRCQRFDFRRLSDSEIGGHIRSIAQKENFSIDDGALTTIIKTADGSLRDAISILDQLVSFSAGIITAEDVNQVFGLPERHDIANLMDAVFAGDLTRSFELFNAFFSAGKSFNLFVRFLMEYFRDLYLVKQGVRPAAEVYADDELAPLKKQAASVARATLVTMLDEIARVEDRIRWETYPRIVLEILMIRLVDMIGGAGLVADERSAAHAPAEPAPAQRVRKPAEPPAEPPVEPPAAPQASPVDEPQQQKRAPAPSAMKPPADEDDVPMEIYERLIAGESGAAKQAAPPAAETKSIAGPPSPRVLAEKEQFENPTYERAEDPDLQALRDSWPAVLEEVRNESLPVYFLAVSGVPAALENGALYVEFDSNHKFQMEKMNAGKYGGLLESAAKKTLGRDLPVRIRQASADSAASIAEQQPAAAGPAPETPDSQAQPSRNLSLFDVLTAEFPESREMK
jgi:DNA polymerase-3 subunit gamma/tau